jgi:hypothetical protein
MSTLSLSPFTRGLHVGSPAKTPPPETQPTRLAWPAAQPAFDNSAINAFLKDAKVKKRLPSTIMRPPTEEMGKWANTTRTPPKIEPLQSSTSSLREVAMKKILKEPSIPSSPIIIAGAQVQKEISAGALWEGAVKKTQPTPKNPSISKTQATDVGIKAQNMAPAPAPVEQVPRENPFAILLKSNKSAIDIENSLFAGIAAAVEAKTENGVAEFDIGAQKTTASPSPVGQVENLLDGVLKSHKPSIDIETNLFKRVTAAVNAATEKIVPKDLSDKANISAIDTFLAGKVGRKQPRNTEARTDFTKNFQPFRVSDISKRSILESAQKSEAPLGFMAAQRRSSVELTPDQQPVQERTEPIEYIPESVENVKRIDSSQWQSSSRESWAYEVDLPQEKKAVEEQLSPAPIVIEEEVISQENERLQKKKAIQALKKRATNLRYKSHADSLIFYEPVAQKLEAPAEIRVQRNVFIPPSISVANFANMLKVPLGTYLLDCLI